ncbi:MAG: hypothetical protein INR72_15550 [Williamsia herbipolensis]|nr:hypothetical protein [Williamsia herbipolensis]
MTDRVTIPPVSTQFPGPPMRGTLGHETTVTQEVCRRHGARRLDLTVVDMAGVEIAPHRLDDGLPDQLRLAAVAVFAGHEVTGLSDPIDREAYTVPGRRHTIEWQQALGQLRNQLEPPPPRHLSAVPS